MDLSVATLDLHSVMDLSNPFAEVKSSVARFAVVHEDLTFAFAAEVGREDLNLVSVARWAHADQTFGAVVAV